MTQPVATAPALDMGWRKRTGVVIASGRNSACARHEIALTVALSIGVTPVHGVTQPISVAPAPRMAQAV